MAFPGAPPGRLQGRIRTHLRVLDAYPRGGGRSGLQPHCEHVHRRVRPPCPGGVSQDRMTAQHFSVTVAYAAPDVEVLVVVKLTTGATVDDAIAQSGIVARLNLDPPHLAPAVFDQGV